jgi:hypothetical protein
VDILERQRRTPHDGIAELHPTPSGQPVARKAPTSPADGWLLRLVPSPPYWTLGKGGRPLSPPLAQVIFDLSYYGP